MLGLLFSYKSLLSEHSLNTRELPQSYIGIFAVLYALSTFDSLSGLSVTESESWVLYFINLFSKALLFGIAVFFIHGWWYTLRLNLCRKSGIEKIPNFVGRNMVALTSLPYVVVLIVSELMVIASLVKYETPIIAKDRYLGIGQDAWVIVVALFALSYLWSIVRSYQAVRFYFNNGESNQFQHLFFFVMLPIGLILLLGYVLLNVPA